MRRRLSTTSSSLPLLPRPIRSPLPIQFHIICPIHPWLVTAGGRPGRAAHQVRLSHEHQTNSTHSSSWVLPPSLVPPSLPPSLPPTRTEFLFATLEFSASRVKELRRREGGREACTGEATDRGDWRGRGRTARRRAACNV